MIGMVIATHAEKLSPTVCLHSSGFVTAALYLSLALNSHGHHHQLATLLSVYFAASVVLILCYAYLREQPLPLLPIFCWALVFRVIGLFAIPPLEDDFYRYLWDGYIFANYGSPYGIAPAEFFTDPNITPQWQAILDGINYPELATIYGPGLQYSFLFSYWLNPGSLITLKTVLIGADIALLLLLSRVVTTPSLLLYAWCPLLIKEIAFTAHPDSIGLLLLMAGIFLHRANAVNSGALCLAAAVACRPFALLMLPLLMTNKPVQSVSVFGLGLLLLYAPFLTDGQTEFMILLNFGQQWEFNSAGFALLTGFMSNANARIVSALLLCLLVAGYWYYYFQHSSRRIPRGDWLFGILLLLSPVINPWYVLWILPFAAIYFSYWAWTTTIVVVLAYVTGLNLNDPILPAYNHPVWLRPLEFIPIACAFAVDIYRQQRGRVKTAAALE